MRNIRVIARLDVKDTNVINTIQLEGLRVVGPASKLALDYYKQGADELIIIDQVASLYNREHLFELTKKFATEIFIPITVGGGIKSVEDAKAILRAGADKIAINTAVTINPRLITDLANKFGKQCVVVSIPCKKKDDGTWEVYRDGGREKTGLDAINWAERSVQLGAGELLITSIDQDGTRSGFDLDLAKELNRIKNTSIIISGGLGNSNHALALLKQSNCDAFAVADFLHMKRGAGIKELKDKISNSNFYVRI
jgi:cyclase